jgi:hypothetical protein
MQRTIINCFINSTHGSHSVELTYQFYWPIRAVKSAKELSNELKQFAGLFEFFLW